MKSVSRVLGLLVVGAGLALAVACGGDDESGDGGGHGGGGFCQVGTKDCGCNLSFGCDEAGVHCVSGTCKECTPGEQGCLCDTSGACSSGMCVDPNPGCMVQCESATCQ